MIEALRNGTRVQHQELDQFLRPVISRLCSEREYVDLLIAFYGFMKPLQDCIDSYLNDTWITDYSMRRKPDRLLNDISVFVLYPASIDLCQRLPAICNVAEALGAYYVLEGSTHGGPFVSKMIRKNLRSNDGMGFSFFEGYGENNSLMWETFVKSVEKMAIDLPDRDILIKSARETFACFRYWLIDAYEQKGNRTVL